MRPALRRVRRRLRQRRLSPVGRGVRQKHLTYLNVDRLVTLERLAADAVPGDFVECGIALGGSAIVLASHLGDERSFHGYDVFGMIPPPGPNDPPEVHERYHMIAGGESAGIGGELYYGYRDDLYERVCASFAEFGLPVDGKRIRLYRGLFEDTLHPAGPVALAHIDSDWYDPVRLCLERVQPQLERGGAIVLDDYNDYGGCRQAADEFVTAHPDIDVEQQPGGNVLLRRT